MKQIKTIICSFSLLLTPLLCNAQSNNYNEESNQQTEQKEKSKKTWEFGIGGSLMQLNRMYFTNFTKHDDGYDFDLKMRHALWGGDIYIARELNKYFFLDLNAGMGGAKVYNMDNKKKTKFYYTTGLGLQWRLTPYFKSKNIEPYFRLGAQYIHREFMVDYSGVDGTDPDLMTWVMKNVHNKDGQDVRNLFSIVGGFGVNMWFNNHVGLGLQMNYMHMPRFISKQKHVADALQGSVRLIFRCGEKLSKDKQPEIVYVDRIVEKPIENVVEIEKIIEKERKVYTMFQNILFDFDSDIISKESYGIIDEIAEGLKEMEGRHFLIIGYTDSKGNAYYNVNLSQRRAKAVVAALESKGIPKDMLKSRGVGKRIAVAAPTADNAVREGDRKVSIEEIRNQQYWDYLPKSDK